MEFSFSLINLHSHQASDSGLMNNFISFQIGFWNAGDLIGPFVAKLKSPTIKISTEAIKSN
jgi:hypothetical protein